MKEKLLEMLRMQKALDESFMEYMGNDHIDIENVRKALFDECGEVCHEMKAEWCYWKKTQKPVDRDKLKEELSDVWHFALSVHYLSYGFEEKLLKAYMKDKDILVSRGWFMNLKCASAGWDALLYTLALTEALGFTFDEIYEGYIAKNKENYERIKRGR